MILSNVVYQAWHLLTSVHKIPICLPWFFYIFSNSCLFIFSCQISHWSEHKEECERLEQQMKQIDVLNDFPFTFSQEATVNVIIDFLWLICWVVIHLPAMVFIRTTWLLYFLLVLSCQVYEKQETRCSFLSKRGIHQVGMWWYECPCEPSVTSVDSLRFLLLLSLFIWPLHKGTLYVWMLAMFVILFWSNVFFDCQIN